MENIISEKYDTLRLEIIPHTPSEAKHGNPERTAIIINNMDILPIIEKRSKSNYHHIWLPELRDCFKESEENNFTENIPLVCCTCDEVRCDSV